MRFLIALFIGAAAGMGAGLLLWNQTDESGLSTQDEETARAHRISKQSSTALPSFQINAALTYAQALQYGNWEVAVDTIQWMRERLQYVQLTTGDPAAVETARSELMEQLLTRTVEGNQLLPEGIEDQYIFVTGATVTTLGTDEGHPNLDQPVYQRIWLRVEYASRTRAVRDTLQLPIRAVTVGVNLSSEGFVLKANVIGNLDIDMESVSYDWN